jgi:metallophosphoesterase (TIGR00282 family)
MRILFIGDIVAKPGRELVRRGLRGIVRRYGVEMVIANAENAAAGAGVTREIVDDLLKSGIDVLTSGNHIWDKREVLEFIGRVPRLIRPANYPPGAPGSGSYVWRSPAGVAVGVVNVMGRVFLATIDDPFAGVLKEIDRVREAGASIVIVDFHAEATSEKVAMGWFLDGRVTAVIGTHTHVQTADERVLPGGTAFLTDVGMTGPHDGIIGMDRAGVLARFTTAIPARFEPATGDPRLHAVLLIADPSTGLATGIERISLAAVELDALISSAASEPAGSLR